MLSDCLNSFENYLELENVDNVMALLPVMTHVCLIFVHFQWIPPSMHYSTKDFKNVSPSASKSSNIHIFQYTVLSILACIFVYLFCGSWCDCPQLDNCLPSSFGSNEINCYCTHKFSFASGMSGWWELIYKLTHKTDSQIRVYKNIIDIDMNVATVIDFYV